MNEMHKFFGFSKGKECGDYCHEMVLRDEDGKDVYTFPSNFYFIKDQSTIENAVQLENTKLGYYESEQTSLKVEKDEVGQIKLTLHFLDSDDKIHTLDLQPSDIKGFRNIDFEQYANAKQPFCAKTAATFQDGAESINFYEDCNTNYDPKIAGLVDQSFTWYSNDEIMIRSPGNFHLMDISPLDGVFITKTDNEYDLKIKMGNKTVGIGELKIDHDNLNMCLSELMDNIPCLPQKSKKDIPPDQIDKLPQENNKLQELNELIKEKADLSNQINQLTQEKDHLSSGHNDLCNQCNKEFSDMGLEYRIDCII